MDDVWNSLARMLPKKKNSLVVPLIVDPDEGEERRESVSTHHERHSFSLGRDSLSQQKKRTPSQAYMQSAKSNHRLSKEINRKTMEPLEYQNPIVVSSKSTFTEGLRRVGWKNFLAASFLVIFSLGVLIGTFASFHSLPRQGFYLFLVIGFVVFVPACYAVYTVIGKFYLWSVTHFFQLDLTFCSLLGKDLNLTLPSRPQRGRPLFDHLPVLY
jgi:hypothetical protein